MLATARLLDDELGVLVREAVLRKSQVLLENYYLPGELKNRIKQFVDYYNHESLDNLTPADVYCGRDEKILNWRAKIKKQSLAERRRLYYQQKAA